MWRTYLGHTRFVSFSLLLHSLTQGSQNESAQEDKFGHLKYMVLLDNHLLLTLLPI